MAAFQQFLMMGLFGCSVLTFVVMIVAYVSIGKVAPDTPEGKKDARLWRRIVISLGFFLLFVLAGVFFWLRGELGHALKHPSHQQKTLRTLQK